MIESSRGRMFMRQLIPFVVTTIVVKAAQEDNKVGMQVIEEGIQTLKSLAVSSSESSRTWTYSFVFFVRTLRDSAPRRRRDILVEVYDANANEIKRKNRSRDCINHHVDCRAPPPRPHLLVLPCTNIQRSTGAHPGIEPPPLSRNPIPSGVPVRPLYLINGETDEVGDCHSSKCVATTSNAAKAVGG